MSVIKDYFGKKLKILRKNNKLTQEELSEMIGINQRQLTRIETGKSYPSFKTVEAICEKLNIKPHDLFDFEEFEKTDECLDVGDDIFEKIKFLEKFPNKINFINLAINALNKDRSALLKMQSVIEGMLLLEE